MKILLFTVLISANFGNLAHLPGYYFTDESGYQFKPCYQDETSYIIQIDDINHVVDYLEEKHDTKLKLIKYDHCKLWHSVVRKNGKLYTLSIVAITKDHINYQIEIFYQAAIGL